MEYVLFGLVVVGLILLVALPVLGAFVRASKRRGPDRPELQGDAITISDPGPRKIRHRSRWGRGAKEDTAATHHERRP